MADAAAVIENAGAPSPSPAPAPAPTPSATPSPSPTPSPAPAPTPSATNILDGGEGDNKSIAAPADWPEDWRAKLAGDDAKALKQIERYASPQDFFKAHLSLRQKISSGELKSTAELPKDATPEQIKEYRAQNNIPETPEAYLADLPQGLVIGENEKPLVDDFAKTMHGLNAPKQFVQAAVEWNQRQSELQQERLYEANKQAQQTTEDELRAEYGNEFRPNINAIKSLLATAPSGVSDLINSAIAPDGVMLLNNPAIVKWLVGLSREINPMATLPPPGNGGGIDIGARKAELTKMAGDRSSDYWKGPNAQALQDEMGQILAYEEKQRK